MSDEVLLGSALPEKLGVIFVLESVLRVFGSSVEF